MKFNKISKGSEAFDTAVKVFNASVDRFDYDGMAGAYNDTEVGGFLSFEYKQGKTAVVSTQLEKRGLKRSEDFDVRSASNEGGEGEEKTATIIIKRLSDKVAGAPQHKARGRKPSAEGSTPTADGTQAQAQAPAPDAPVTAPASTKGKGK